MLGERWICDSTPTERFPDYTRGNAAEVMADPFSPLGWTFCWEPGAVLGCRDGFEQMGVFDASEYGSPPECFGVFGGYFYNSLTQARLFGVRAGVGATAIDQTYFDETMNIPTYVEKPWHASPRHTEKLGSTMGWIMSTDNVPEIEWQKIEAKALRDSRPDLSALSNVQLVARARSLQRHLRAFFSQVVWASLGASVGPGALAALTGEIDPTAVSTLITGVGGVDSADIANRIFRISRIVNRSEQLTKEFDGDLDGLLDRVRASNASSNTPDLTAFLEAIDAFLYEHGSRGPNEWDIYYWSYETRPKMLMQAIERVRRAADDTDPVVAEAKGAAARAAAIAKYEELFKDNAEALATFQAAVKSAAVFMSSRERCKCSNIRAHGEVRMCFFELGRRMVAAGHLAHERQVCMLLASELDDFLADPASFTAKLAEREQDFLSLSDLEPPYIIENEAAPLSQWTRRSTRATEQVKVGDVLKGVAGSPGKVTGTARVIVDLDDAGRLEPDDILIAPQTDPAWTPLFLTAGGVVTNVGAVGTHAVIVSRELGIPCVPSIPDATLRIPDGATITLDGGLGTVTIEAVP